MGRGEIQFRCSRCTSELIVLAGRAETTMLCPFCQATCRVPKESSRPAVTDVYSTLADGQAPPEASGIVVVCDRCKTRIDAAREQIGTKIPCPECRTMVLVTLSKPARAASAPVVTVAAADVYRVCPGVDHPPPDNKSLSQNDHNTLSGFENQEGANGFGIGLKEVDQRYIPVTCPRCGTRTHATEDQVGRMIACPDCGTPSPVFAPPPKPEIAKPKTDEIYGVRSETEPVVQIRYTTAICPRCRTRLKYPEDEAGRKVCCPDCGSPIVIAPPRASAPGPLPDDEDFVPAPEVGKPEECGAFWGQILRSARAAAASVADESAAPAMPRWPLVTGIVGFLFRPEILRLWLGFSMLLATFVILVYGAVRAGGAFSGGVGITGFAAGFICMALTVACVMMILLWSVFGGPYLLAIVRDTAMGQDEVSWPSELWLDRYQEILYWINSLVVAWMVAGFAGLILSLLGQPPTPGRFVGFLAAFPLVFLSMLETGSPWDPCSPVFCRSLWRAWRGWIVFYLETTLMLLAVVTAADAVLLWLDSWLGVGVVCPLLAASLILYFRLLGRLAWYCAVKTLAQEKPREEDSVEETMGSGGS